MGFGLSAALGHGTFLASLVALALGGPERCFQGTALIYVHVFSIGCTSAGIAALFVAAALGRVEAGSSRAVTQLLMLAAIAMHILQYS